MRIKKNINQGITSWSNKQILPGNIKRIVWWTIGRISNEILIDKVKGLIPGQTEIREIT